MGSSPKWGMAGRLSPGLFQAVCCNILVWEHGRKQYVTAVFLVLELRFSVDTFNQTQMNRWGRTSTVFTNQLHRRAQTLKMLISQVDPRWNIGWAAVYQFCSMKYGVTGPLATKRYAQPKKQLYKMMLQVPHTYPGGAYKKPLVFLLWMLKTDAQATKISPSLFVVSPSLFSNHLCSKPSMVSNMRVN